MPASSPLPVLFGRRLHAIRKLRGFTQAELGERADVTSKSVSEIERGVGNPTLDLVGRLARALGVEPWVLLRFEEARPEGRSAVEAARGLTAAERVASYLSGRRAQDIELALRIIEVVLGEAPAGQGKK